MIKVVKYMPLTKCVFVCNLKTQVGTARRSTLFRIVRHVMPLQKCQNAVDKFNRSTHFDTETILLF